jgi:hypothetical protein
VDRLYQHYVPKEPSYRAMLDKIHQYLLPRTYTEIGVFTGVTLTLALRGTQCVGVDPEPKVRYHLVPGTQVFSQTSDDFFATHNLTELFGGRPVDLAFIDGMHNFEFALRDFMNLERASSPSSTILIHDCLPIDEITSTRERTTEIWSGDIWRLILLLRKWRPDLEVAVIDRAPTGIGLVRGLDPKSSVLADNYDEIVDHYLSVPYKDLDNGSKAEQLNRVDGDWETVKALLPDRPFRRASVNLLKADRTLEAVRHARRQRSARPVLDHSATGTTG